VMSSRSSRNASNSDGSITNFDMDLLPFSVHFSSTCSAYPIGSR
jgi:hypothetical protein